MCIHIVTLGTYIEDLSNEFTQNREDPSVNQLLQTIIRSLILRKNTVKYKHKKVVTKPKKKINIRFFIYITY